MNPQTQDSLPKPGISPLPWTVRYNASRTDCFVESAKPKGRAYAQEVMGDDYFPECSREADSLLIVAAVAAYTEAKLKKKRYKRNRADVIAANDCARAIIGEIEKELKVEIPLRICVNSAHAIQTAIQMSRA